MSSSYSNFNVVFFPRDILLNSSYGILGLIPPSLYPVETSSLFASGLTIRTKDLSKEFAISSLYHSFLIANPINEVKGF